MKKTILGILLFASLATAQAAVTVTQNGKISTYKSGTPITVTGTADVTINYEGVSVFIPKGQKITIRPGKGNNIVLRGENLSGVTVGNNTLSNEGKVTFSVNTATQEIAVQEGNLNFTDNTGKMITSSPATTSSQKTTATQPQKTDVASVDNTEDNTEIPLFVAMDTITDTAYEQAVQDVEQELSPSAPRE